MSKIILSFFFLYFLAVFQISFLPQFDIFGIIPNVVLFFVVAFSLLESPSEKAGYIIAFFGGFYSDIFSFRNYGFFGFYIILFFCISFLLKFFLKKYVRFPTAKTKYRH